MKITMLTYGSRGDVQPFLPLSLKLMEHGHSVRLAAPFRFKNFIEEHHIDFAPLAGDPEDLSRRLNSAGPNFVKLLQELMNHVKSLSVKNLTRAIVEVENEALRKRVQTVGQEIRSEDGTSEAVK